MKKFLHTLDLTLDGAAAALDAWIGVHKKEASEARKALLARLPADLAADVDALLDLRANVEQAKGGDYVLRRLGAVVRSDAARKLREQAEQLSNLNAALFRERRKHESVVAGKDAMIARLEAQVRRLQGPKVPDLTVQADFQAPTVPEWTPPVVKPRRQADEVHPVNPQTVDMTARVVEDFVIRRGGCLKSDVSAAMPHLQELSAAYRHLKLTGRLIVDGHRLSVPVKAAP